jgi:ATP-dependent Clp protease ATP-binding subunit ClpC
MFERFTDSARAAIVRAQEEARALSHNYIGTEHILLGVLADGDCLAVRSLESMSISPEALREQVLGMIGTGKARPTGHIPFTPRAKKVLELSLREALQIDDNHIGTEHILLGLLREGDGVAAQAFAVIGVTLAQVRQQVLVLQQRKVAGAAGEGAAGPGRPVRLEERSGALGDLRRRLDEFERWSGVAADLAELDGRIAQLRRDKEAAIERQDFQEAAQLRNQERELVAERVTRLTNLLAGPSPADQVSKLRSEVARLRALLREHGIEPGDAT